MQSKWEDFLDEATELDARALGPVAEVEFASAEGSWDCVLVLMYVDRRERAPPYRYIPPRARLKTPTNPTAHPTQMYI